MLITFIVVLICCWRINTINSNNKKVDIYNVVKEALITDKGYSEELSNYMLENVFMSTNIYHTYNPYEINNAEYKEPYKINLTLTEDSQDVTDDMVYVKMTYSFDIMDLDGGTIGDSKDVRVAFTVKRTGDDWCIIDKSELA